MGFLNELVPQTSLIIATYQTPDHSLCAHQEHFDIINIIESGDVSAAQEAMDSHIQHIQDKLDLNENRSRGDLYAAFSHMKDKQEER